MPEYNKAMFATYASGYLLFKELHGETAALKFMRTWFERNLKPAYEAMDIVRGSTADAARVIGARDAAVGLDVRFPVIEKQRLVYEFHTDPFPMLRGLVNPRVFDNCYMGFKIAFLLGNAWTYTTPEHIWENGRVTRHVIKKE